AFHRPRPMTRAVTGCVSPGAPTIKCGVTARVSFRRRVTAFVLVPARLQPVRRMLLTSAGIRNDVLKSALAGLIGKSFESTLVVFIPTASVATAGDHGWLVQDLNRLHELGWREFNVLELNGLPGQLVLGRLRHAD